MQEAARTGEADGPRVMPAVHANRPIQPDPRHEVELALHLKATLSDAEICDLYGRFSAGLGAFDGMMRRVVWRAMARGFGDSVNIAPGASFRHLESVTIGSGVFIGEAALVQGHFYGDCRIGDRAWIGPQAFLDARALMIEESAAIAPGARILTAEHSGLPPDAAVLATDQIIGPVRIGAGSDIGTGAVVLPRCRIGRGVIVGAGAVVTRDLPDRAIAAGTPAVVLRFRGESALGPQ